MIWEVLITLLFYATPIIYPLQMMPEYIQRVLLLNPMAFIIHFTKEGLINNHFADIWKTSIFVATVAVAFLFSIWSYRKLIPKIAEEI
jgi:lipopolysaccharide transport system permease protein